MSTLKVEVVPVIVEDIPGADRVGKVRVYGYVCVTAKDQWKPGDLGAFVPPDSLVDLTRPEFSFLDKPRIKGKKIRGVLSSGLLVKAPEGSKEGDDVAEQLGVTKYNPVAPKGPKGHSIASGEADVGPGILAPKYDLESGQRYAQVTFAPGEEVIITEKLHGANARYVYFDGKMHCGSRGEWKREYPDVSFLTREYLEARGTLPDKIDTIIEAAQKKQHRRNTWWVALDNTPGLRAFCEANPGLVVYGEVYGAVQDLSYGHAPGQVSFAAFDVLHEGEWLRWDHVRPALEAHGVPCVPHVSREPYSIEACLAHAEGKTLVPGATHVREGVVVRAVEGDYRVLKFVGVGYLERSSDNFIGEGD